MAPVLSDKKNDPVTLNWYKATSGKENKKHETITHFLFLGRRIIKKILGNSTAQQWIKSKSHHRGREV